MVEGLEQLIALRDVDASLEGAEAGLAGLPTARAACAARREAADARMAEAKQQLADAETVQRGAETELQDKEALLGKLEGQQHQVKSNEAYAALLREMEEAREAISLSETQILEAMETIEEARGQLEQVQREVTAQLEQVADEERGLDAKEGQLGAQAEELRARRAAVYSEVPPQLAADYEKVAKRARPALVHVVKEICQGCRMNLPPQLQIDMLRGERVHSCPSCRRLLIPETARN